MKSLRTRQKDEAESRAHAVRNRLVNGNGFFNLLIGGSSPQDIYMIVRHLWIMAFSPDKTVQGMNMWNLLSGNIRQSRIWSFGRNLANQTEGNPVTAHQASLNVFPGTPFCCVDAGLHHSAAATADGDLYLWGWDSKGQVAADCFDVVMVQEHQVQIELAKQVFVKKPKVDLSVVLKRKPLFLSVVEDEGDDDDDDSNGSQDGSGEGLSDSDSDGGKDGERSRAVFQNGCLKIYRLNLGSKVKLVACGGMHTLVLLEETQAVMGWGDNTWQQVGVKGEKQIKQPMVVTAFDARGVCMLAAGLKHSAAVTANGRLWTWGHGKYGRLGHGTEPKCLLPTKVSSLRSMVVTQVVCGSAHTLALTSDGHVYSWGYGGHGALGLGNLDNAFTPALVPLKNTVIKVSASCVSLAVTEEGLMYMWGCSNVLGRPGLTLRQQCSPYLLEWALTHKVQLASVGMEHGVAFTTDHKLLLWGNKHLFPRDLMDHAVSRKEVYHHNVRQSYHHSAFVRGSVDLSSAGKLSGSFHSPRLSRQLYESVDVPSAAAPLRPNSSKRTSMTQPDSEKTTSFNVEQEGVQQIACGGLHTLLLALPSDYTPNVELLRTAMIQITADYARVCNPILGFGRTKSMRTAVRRAVSLTQKDASSMLLTHVMLLCRDLGLLDNSVEHADVAEAFYNQIAKRDALSWLNKVTRTTSPPPKPDQKQNFLDIVKQATAGRDVPKKKKALSVTVDGVPDPATATATPTSKSPVIARQQPQHATKALNTKSKPTVRKAITASTEESPPSLDAAEVVELLLKLVKHRNPKATDEDDLIKLLARKHMLQLFERPIRGTPWVLRQAMETQILMVLDSGKNRLTLHQVYLYLSTTGGTSLELQLPLCDIQEKLNDKAGTIACSARGVSLERCTTFLYQTGLMPRIVSSFAVKILQELQELTTHMELASANSLTFMARELSSILGNRRDGPKPCTPDLFDSVLESPNAVSMMLPSAGNDTAKSTARMEMAFSFAKGARPDVWASMASLQQAQAKKAAKSTRSDVRRKEKWMAYILQDLLGSYLVPTVEIESFRDEPQDVDDILTYNLSYPKFVELIAVCVTLKLLTDEYTLMDQVVEVTLKDIHAAIVQHMVGILQWREKILSPKKVGKVKQDDDLEREVERCFDLFCSMDTAATRLGVDRYRFIDFIKQLNVVDNRVTLKKMIDMFNELTSGFSLHDLYPMRSRMDKFPSFTKSMSDGSPDGADDVGLSWNKGSSHSSRANSPLSGNRLGGKQPALAAAMSWHDLRSQRPHSPLSTTRIRGKSEPPTWSFPYPFSEDTESTSAAKLYIPPDKDPSSPAEQMHPEIAEPPVKGQKQCHPSSLSELTIGLGNYATNLQPGAAQQETTEIHAAAQPERPVSGNQGQLVSGQAEPEPAAPTVEQSTSSDIMFPVEAEDSIALSSYRSSNASEVSLSDLAATEDLPIVERASPAVLPRRTCSETAIGLPAHFVSPTLQTQKVPLQLQNQKDLMHPRTSSSSLPISLRKSTLHKQSFAVNSGIATTNSIGTRSSASFMSPPALRHSQPGRFSKPTSPLQQHRDERISTSAQELVSLLRSQSFSSERRRNTMGRLAAHLLAPEKSALKQVTFPREGSKDVQAAVREVPGGRLVREYTAIENAMLTRANFVEAVQRIAVLKYPKISSPLAAWRLLVERSLLPIVDNKSGKYDEYLSALRMPAAIATIAFWRPSLKALFKECLAKVDQVYPEWNPLSTHRSTATTEADAESKKSSKTPCSERTNEGTEDEDNLDGVASALSFSEFLQLCQHFGIIPTMMQPTEMEEMYRYATTKDDLCNEVIKGLDFPAFVETLCLAGLVIYSQQRYHQQLPLVENRLEAMFSTLGLRRPPMLKKQVNGQQRVQNPFKDWLNLPIVTSSYTKSVSAYSHFSTEEYRPVLLQEAIIPPWPCPPSVQAQLERAHDLHNNRQCKEALAELHIAQQEWSNDSMPRPKAATNPEGAAFHAAERCIYFACRMGAIHATAGHYQEAIELGLDALQRTVSILSDTHPAFPVLHNCLGWLYHHSGCFMEALEHFVQAKVMRDDCPLHGPRHVDSALVAHNLGCLLDCLGQVQKAVDLVSRAHKVFKEVLGNTHLRTVLAARNLAYMKQRCSHITSHWDSIGCALHSARRHTSPQAEDPHGTSFQHLCLAMPVQSRLCRAAHRCKSEDTTHGRHKGGEEEEIEEEDVVLMTARSHQEAKDLWEVVKGDVQLQAYGEPVTGDLASSMARHAAPGGPVSQDATLAFKQTLEMQDRVAQLRAHFLRVVRSQHNKKAGEEVAPRFRDMS